MVQDISSLLSTFFCRTSIRKNMLASHVCGLSKNLFFSLLRLCVMIIILGLTVPIFILPFALLSITSISFGMFAGIYHFYVGLARDVTSFVINHFSWLIILVLVICLSMPNLQHATIEELKEEVEKRETNTRARSQRSEEYERTLRFVKEILGMEVADAREECLPT
jgi:hypothetical protein